MTANRELAAELVRQADDATRQRRVLLTASVALSTTTTVAAARRALADPELRIPADVRTAALQLLGELGSE